MGEEISNNKPQNVIKRDIKLEACRQVGSFQQSSKLKTEGNHPNSVTANGSTISDYTRHTVQCTDANHQANKVEIALIQLGANAGAAHTSFCMQSQAIHEGQQHGRISINSQIYQPMSVPQLPHANLQTAGPGAYAAGPGVQPQRRIQVCYTGASTLSNAVQATQSEDIEAGLVRRPEHGLAMHGLAVAKAVDDDTTSISEAQQVFPKKMQLGATIQKGKARRAVYCIMTMVCVSAVAMALGLVSKQHDGPASLAPTMAPSVSLSSAPSATEGLFDGELPDYTLEALQDPFSPQYLAYEWLSGHPKLDSLMDWEKKQLFAMVTFYYAMDGPHWPYGVRKSWLDYEVESPCNWYSSSHGLLYYGEEQDLYFELHGEESNSCNERGDIRQLALSQVNLILLEVPFIPPEVGLLTSLDAIDLLGTGLKQDLSDFLPPLTIQGLTNLRRLNLAGNNLSGPLSSDFGLLAQLQDLGLNSNSLSGSIPSEIGLMTSLESLRVSSNNLSFIPSELGQLTKLTELNMSANKLGTIPSAIFKLTRLQELTLSSISVTGEIPHNLKLLTNLQHLFLNRNFLSGSIPIQVAQLTNLEQIQLDNNLLSGPLPLRFAAMPSLSALYLSNNALSGSIPSNLGTLTWAKFLELGSNLFAGTIPTQLGLLDASKLHSLYLNSNNLSGLIPTQLGLLGNHDLAEDFGLPSNSLYKLRSFGLDLSSNNLSGPIPSQLGLVRDLGSKLVLASNFLSGSIPTEIGVLSLVTGIMDLSENQLTAQIPSEFGMLSDLQSLAIGSNSITGTIPAEIARMRLLARLDLSNLSLSGTVPLGVAALVENNELRIFDISSNRNLTGNLSGGLEFCSLNQPDCPDSCDIFGICRSCSFKFDCTEQLSGCGCLDI